MRKWMYAFVITLLALVVTTTWAIGQGIGPFSDGSSPQPNPDTALEESNEQRSADMLPA